MSLRSRATTLRERLIPQRAGWLLASGVLLGVAQPPFHLLFPSFLALVPYLLWVADLPDGKAGRVEARRGGFFLAWVFYTLVLYWLVTALIWYTSLAVLAFLSTVLILSVMLAYMTVGIHLAHRRLGWPLWLALPVFWTANEWALAHLPDIAFPWMQLGDSLTGFPRLIGAADVVGSRGLSFWLCLVNGLLAACVLAWKGARAARSRLPAESDLETTTRFRKTVDREARSRFRAILAPAAGLLLALAVPLGYSLYRWSNLKVHPAATVGVIQPNVAEEAKFERETATLMAIQATERLVDSRLSEWQGKLDLLVLPETALPVYLEPIPSAGYLGRPQLERWAERLAWGTGARVLFGALGSNDLGNGKWDYFNSAFLVTPKGERAGRYDKHYLVPVVERIPFLNPRWFSGLHYAGGFGVGREAPVLPTDGAKFGVFICYESIYPQLNRHYRREGADFLVNITNDAWFGRAKPWWSRTSALWQHPAHMVMRAVEARVGVVRSGNTGISMLVDPRGRVHHATELFTEAAFSGEVMTTDGLTPFVRYGDVTGWLSILTVLGVVGALVLRRRRPQADDDRETSR